ncbi:aldo/keto reductase [bacterium]|nr:aldo/keto reductase [candidate division CSSED10-310 bacterium]
MQFRTVKKNGDSLSVLGFGCMRLPMRGHKIDEATATRQVRRAIELGVNYIDTALPYHNGASEPFVGRALAGGYRDRVRIATKLPPWCVDTREDMGKILDAQLARLRTDHIDYYLLHSLDAGIWSRLNTLGVLEFVEESIAAGKIINAGFSFHGDRDAFKTIVDAYGWTFCMIQFNYLDEYNQAGIEGLRYAAARDMAVMVMEPLRGGHLAGRVPESVQRLWDESPARRSAADWALRWVLNHGEVTTVLSGMNVDSHIEENIAVASEAGANELNDEELRLVGRVKEEYRRLLPVDCTGCRYCMPCPAGVDIPTCFEYYNNAGLFRDKLTQRALYLGRLGGIVNDQTQLASLCVRCGKCLDRCPQHLPIPDLLEDVARHFETRLMKPLAWLGRRYMAFQRWSTLRSGRRLK